MSDATSAEVVGIWKSPVTGEEDEEVGVPDPGTAIIATEAGLLVTRVTAEVDVLSGLSFCWTATHILITWFYVFICNADFIHANTKMHVENDSLNQMLPYLSQPVGSDNACFVMAAGLTLIMMVLFQRLGLGARFVPAVGSPALAPALGSALVW